METLYLNLYKLFSNELMYLNVGYNMNETTLCKMMSLLNAIDYIQYGNPTSTEIVKIIQYYENI